MARRAVPGAERSVRRRKRIAKTHVQPGPFRPSLRCGRGQRSALSLPVKGRALAAGEVDERPGFRARDEFLPHGVFQNVISLLTTAFIVAQAMLKEIPLPNDADCFRRPLLPFTDDGLQRLAGGRKGNQRMQMIRHQQKNVWPPQKLFLPVPDGFKQTRRNFRQGKLVAAAFPTVDGDKINFPVWVNPQWHVMWQGFSLGRVHGGKGIGFASGWQTKKGRDSALRCPRPSAKRGRNGRG